MAAVGDQTDNRDRSGIGISMSIPNASQHRTTILHDDADQLPPSSLMQSTFLSNHASRILPLSDDDSPPFEPDLLPTLRSQYSIGHEHVERGQPIPNQIIPDKDNNDYESKEGEHHDRVNEKRLDGLTSSCANTHLNHSADGSVRLDVSDDDTDVPRQHPPYAASYPHPFLSSASLPLPAPSSSSSRPSTIPLDYAPITAVIPKAPPLVTAATRIRYIDRQPIRIPPPPPTMPSPYTNSMAQRIRVAMSDSTSYPSSNHFTSSSVTPIAKPSSPSPPLPRRVWLGVPKELVREISSYLDSRSLARFTSVDRCNHEVGKDQRLWRHLAQQQEEYGDGYQSYEKDMDPKQFLLERWLHYVSQRRQRISFHHLAIRQAGMERRGYICHIFNDYIFLSIQILLFLLGWILLVWELQTSGHVSMTSLWPYVAMILFTFTLIPFFCWQRWKDQHITIEDEERYTHTDDRCSSVCHRCWYHLHRCTFHATLPSTWFRESHSPIRQVMDLFSQDNPYSHRTGCVITIIWMMFLIFFIFRLTGVVTFSWTWVFLLSYIFFGLMLGVPWYDWCGFQPSSNIIVYRPWLKLWLLVLLPLSTFFVMVHIQLEFQSTDLTMSTILSPLFYMDLMSLLYAMHRVWDDGYGPQCSMVIGWLGSWALVWGPPLIFKILLILMYDDGRSWSYAILFIPLNISIFVGLMFGMFLMYDICLNSEAKWPEMPPDHRE